MRRNQNLTSGKMQKEATGQQKSRKNTGFGHAQKRARGVIKKFKIQSGTELRKLREIYPKVLEFMGGLKDWEIGSISCTGLGKTDKRNFGKITMDDFHNKKWLPKGLSGRQCTERIAATAIMCLVFSMTRIHSKNSKPKAA